MQQWQADLQERLDRVGRDARASQIRTLRETFLDLISNADEKQQPQVISEIAVFTGTDPALVMPNCADDGSDEPRVLYRQKKPKFGFEELDQCLQDACDAAGGVWKDPEGWAPPGCYYREGTTFAERRATDFAYAWGIVDCEARTVGGLLRGLISIFR